MGTIDGEDLRSGQPPWHDDLGSPLKRTISESLKVDVAIVGGGITGALVAEALVETGLTLAIIERGRPGYGSTVASTAMLLWELDTSLTDLTHLYGSEKAVRCYRRSHAAMLGLRDLIDDLRIDCSWSARNGILLSARDADGLGSLSEEFSLRKSAGLPGHLLDANALHERHRLRRAGAILSPDCAEADPLRMTNALLIRGLAGGAQLIDGNVVRYHSDSRSAALELDSGLVVEAAHAVLATGYDMPDFLRSPLHKISSSWCFATTHQPEQGLWPGRTLLWEDDDPYVYARTTSDGRILVGGEDQTTPDAETREALTSEKCAVLASKMHALWPGADYTMAARWSAEFGSSTDGLPLIGPVPGAPRLLAAYGYGGNGITFGFMASRILRAMLVGEGRDWFEDFAIERDPPPR